MAVCLEQQWACFQKTPGNNWGCGWGWGVGGESATEPASHKWQVLKREVHQKQNWSLPAAQLNYHSASYNFTTFHGRLSRTAVGLLSKTRNNLMVKMNLFDQTDWEWIIDCGCGGLTYFCRWVSEMLSLHNSWLNMPCQPSPPPPPKKRKKERKKRNKPQQNKQQQKISSTELCMIWREREGKKLPWIGVRLFH